jgi:formate-dependent phosphoribosylglycinamide formyltransferase (GAR transformylase)
MNETRLMGAPASGHDAAARVMRPLTTLLVANRGEIAVRVARTARRLGIATVAVYSDADRANPHVAACDTAVPIGGLTPTESYLVIDKIIAAARKSGADAVHPGYGFLAENTRFASAVAAAGLIFVGPPPVAIEAMGDKARARHRMAAAGIPVAPGYDGDDQSDARLMAEADRIGFPIMVKASAGGGGRGMRKVEARESVPSSSRATWRSRSLPTGTATRCISASATALCSAATRKSSRRRRRLPSTRRCGAPWAPPPSRWRARSAMRAPARSNSCSIATAVSTSWK